MGDFSRAISDSLVTNRKPEGRKRRVATRDYHRQIGVKYDLFHFTGSYMEVDLDDVRSANRILAVIGRDGALQLHLHNATSP